MIAAMPKTMYIVSSFTKTYNTDRQYYEITSDETNLCPYCGGILKYKDRKLRGVLNDLRVKTFYFLRRLRCLTCRHIHTELPDFIQPYKHYGSEVVQSVLDGEDANDVDESTIRRWRKDFRDAEEDVSGRIVSVLTIEASSPTPLFPGSMLLDIIRRREPRWLSFVMKLLLCRGHRLYTRFAFCPASGFVKVDDIGNVRSIQAKGEKNHDKSAYDTG